MYNNIYVKNFPKEWKEDKLREIFGKYGEISSLYRVENEAGAFAFICFGTKDGDKNSAYDSAQAAVKDLNGKEINDKLKWYVK